MNLAFVVTDSKNNIAILSGIHDDENSWELNDGLFKNKNIPYITLEITDDNKYIYGINCKDELNIQIMALDLSTELSDKCSVNDFIDNIKQEDCCEIIEDNYLSKKIKFNIFDTNINIIQNTVQLMRGKRKMFTVIM